MGRRISSRRRRLSGRRPECRLGRRGDLGPPGVLLSLRTRHRRQCLEGHRWRRTGDQLPVRGPGRRFRNFVPHRRRRGWRFEHHPQVGRLEPSLMPGKRETGKSGHAAENQAQQPRVKQQRGQQRQRQPPVLRLHGAPRRPLQAAGGGSCPGPHDVAGVTPLRSVTLPVFERSEPGTGRPTCGSPATRRLRSRSSTPNGARHVACARVAPSESRRSASR